MKLWRAHNPKKLIKITILLSYLFVKSRPIQRWDLENDRILEFLEKLLEVNLEQKCVEGMALIIMC